MLLLTQLVPWIRVNLLSFLLACMEKPEKKKKKKEKNNNRIVCSWIYVTLGDMIGPKEINNHHHHPFPNVKEVSVEAIFIIRFVQREECQ